MKLATIKQMETNLLHFGFPQFSFLSETGSCHVTLADLQCAFWLIRLCVHTYVFMNIPVTLNSVISGRNEGTEKANKTKHSSVVLGCTRTRL